jgi:3-hydroxyisobutyrate dehydrogenase-like beta-hydroxyacid dehydrogenase
VGIVGLGNMGSALATSLLNHGYSVTVWNRTRSKETPLVALGAHAADCVLDVASRSDVLLACVLDHAVTMGLIAKPEVAEAMSGRTLIQLSTMTAAESQVLGAWAQTNAIAYLDGQILDYPVNIRNSTATVVCSGPQGIFHTHEEMLAAMAGKAVFVSEKLGAAPALDKAILSFGCGVYTAFLHGTAMCHAAGVPLDLFLERELSYVRDGRLGCDFASLARMIGTRTYHGGPEARIDVWVAALTRTIDQCDALGIATDHLLGIRNIMERVTARGHGDSDFAAVFEELVAQGNQD